MRVKLIPTLPQMSIFILFIEHTFLYLKWKAIFFSTGKYSSLISLPIVSNSYITRFEMTKPANLQNIDILFWNPQYFQRCRIKPLGKSDNWLRKKWFPIASNVTGCVRLTIAVLQIRKKKVLISTFQIMRLWKHFKHDQFVHAGSVFYFLSSFLPSFFHLRTLNKTMEVAHPSSDLGISGNNWDDFFLFAEFFQYLRINVSFVGSHLTVLARVFFLTYCP